MEADGQFVCEGGLQDMSGTNGFTSWISLPHFLYASTAIQQTFDVNPSKYLHLPFVSTLTTAVNRRPIRNAYFRLGRYSTRDILFFECFGVNTKPRSQAFADTTNRTA